MSNSYTMDSTGRLVAAPLPEIDDRHGLEIPAEPSLAEQVAHLTAKVTAQELAIDELAEALTALAKTCHELAKTTGKLHEHHTTAAVTGALLRSVK